MATIKNVDSLTNKQKIFTSLISGSLAGAAAKTSIAPLDRAKINFQGKFLKSGLKPGMEPTESERSVRKILTFLS
jgi:hypothetical protein